jgi:hypothetical protein
MCYVRHDIMKLHGVMWLLATQRELSLGSTTTEATSLDINTPFSRNRRFAPAAGRLQMGGRLRMKCRKKK